MVTIRQGDLLFIPTTGVGEYETRDTVRREDGVIQEGEATGHNHRVKLEDMPFAEVFRPSFGEAVVRVSERGVSIVHEEHGPVTLEPGTYRVHVAREFDYTSRIARRVRD